jgi:hypothetical protein
MGFSLCSPLRFERLAATMNGTHAHHAMKRQPLVVLLWTISLILMIQEFRLMAVVNYRKMSPDVRMWSYVAAISLPVIIGACLWTAQRVRRRIDHSTTPIA